MSAHNKTKSFTYCIYHQKLHLSRTRRCKHFFVYLCAIYSFIKKKNTQKECTYNFPLAQLKLASWINFAAATNREFFKCAAAAAMGRTENCACGDICSQSFLGRLIGIHTHVCARILINIFFFCFLLFFITKIF